MFSRKLRGAGSFVQYHKVSLAYYWVGVVWGERVSGFTPPGAGREPVGSRGVFGVDFSNKASVEETGLF